jgi:hypothetical protein
MSEITRLLDAINGGDPRGSHQMHALVLDVDEALVKPAQEDPDSAKVHVA